MNIYFYINGTLVDPPMEYKSIELELNFEDLDSVRASIGADKFTWVRGAADALNKILTDGSMSVGFGLYWSPTLKIYTENNLLLFDGFIDLVNDAEFSCEKVITKVKEAKKLDWMDEVADGITFDLMRRINLIVDADYVKCPYINNDIPDYKGAALFLISAYVMTQELFNVVKEIAFIVGDMAGGFNVGGGVIKLIFYIVYLSVLLVAIYKLIKEIIAELIQPVRYHLVMSFKRHFEIMCTRLGLTFSSSIFDASIPTNNELASGIWEGLYLMPIKTKRGFKRNESTGLQVGHFDGTFGDWIRACNEMFNAKVTIIGTTMHFERVDFCDPNLLYQIPGAKQKVSPSPSYEFKGTNASDIVSNYLIQFQIDQLDLNTIDRYDGTNCKNQITSTIQGSPMIEMIKGFKQPAIPFALGRRKNELTRVENFFKDFLNLVETIIAPIVTAMNAAIAGAAAFVTFINKIIDALNKLPLVNITKFNVPSGHFEKPNFSEVIEGRIGMLLLTHELTGVPKCILLEGTGWDVRVRTDNETLLSAYTLWTYYHYLESFVPSTNRPLGNQQWIYEIPTIPFCIEDYYKIRGVNNEKKGEAKIITPNLLQGKLLSLRWNIWRDKAKVRYTENRLFTSNLTEQQIINTGQ